MARESGLSRATVRRIRKAFGPRPRRSGTSELSSDPAFVAEVRDVVGIHPSPPDRALVLRVDEKSQPQALDRTRPVPATAPGVPERRTRDYKRNGTTSPVAAPDVATGFAVGKCCKRHRAKELLDFLEEIDAHVPEDLDVRVVMDDSATHETAPVKSWLARRPRCRAHSAPTSASWTDQVERWFAEPARKQPRRGAHASTKQLEAGIRAFIEKHDQDPKPSGWTKSAAASTTHRAANFRFRTLDRPTHDADRDVALSVLRRLAAGPA